MKVATASTPGISVAPPDTEGFSGLSGRSLRRTLRGQVVARGRRRERSSRLLPPVQWALAPGVGFREPISFINCSTSTILHQSSFLQSPLSTRRSSVDAAGDTVRASLKDIIRSAQKQSKQEAQCFLVLSSACAVCFSARKFFFQGPSGGGSLSGDQRALSCFAAPNAQICLYLVA